MKMTRVVVCVWFAMAAARSADISSELGHLGEIPIWLTLPMLPLPFDQDPFEAAGGESAFAAMKDVRRVPSAGQPLEVPGSTEGGTLRVGSGVWEGTRMSSPDLPGIWNEFPRLVITQGVRYAYCRLDSPQSMKANLLTGVQRGQCRLYLNGTDVATFEGGHGWETAREVPIELKEGANHLLVRFSTEGSFACRLVGEMAEPLCEVRAVVQAPNAAAVQAPPREAVTDNQRLLVRAREIPSLDPPEHPELLGGKLARTMALLESGRFTHRPVRIVFSGQSIETEWTRLLIQHLRDRYPGTTIIAENRAIGGWFVWRMQKLIKHDILRWQPDLVLFSAYQGTAETWERFLSELRSETTAEIVIRTHHLSGRDSVEDALRYSAECLLMRRLAVQYDVELVDVRREWARFLQANEMEPKDLLRDGIHLNANGETLMALLYERHFTPDAPGRQGWADTVRRFHVGTFLEDNRRDEIVLEGEGWSGDRVAKSNAAEDRLRLRFTGNRVDLVMPTTHGRAQVLINGRPPGEWNLFRATRPQPRNMQRGAPNIPMTMHLGPDMQQETWVLSLLEGNVDEEPKNANQRIRFSLAGSKTGFDGEGWNDRKFVSNSGRITLLPTDWQNRQVPPAADKPAPEMQPIRWAPQIVWHILPTGLDTVPHGPGWAESLDYYSGQPYDYVTVADGLPFGTYELTLIPIPDANPHRVFTIVGVDVHRPPLARDAARRTVHE